MMHQQERERCCSTLTESINTHWFCLHTPFPGAEKHTETPTMSQVCIYAHRNISRDTFPCKIKRTCTHNEVSMCMHTQLHQSHNKTSLLFIGRITVGKNIGQNSRLSRYTPRLILSVSVSQVSVIQEMDSSPESTPGFLSHCSDISQSVKAWPKSFLTQSGCAPFPPSSPQIDWRMGNASGIIVCFPPLWQLKINLAIFRKPLIWIKVALW